MKKNEGYIYVLSNPEFPYLYKVGRSINGGKQRAQELYTSGVPTPFKLEFEVLTPDCFLTEQLVHKALFYARHNDNREFFNETLRNIVTEILKVVKQQYNGRFQPMLAVAK